MARKSAMQHAYLMGVLPQQQRTTGVPMPAPVGGINTISPASAMRATDCLSLTNLIPFQYGLRVRSGYYEWTKYVRDLVSMENEFAAIRTLIPFTGSADSGSRDRLFAVTTDGIYDVTKADPDNVAGPTLMFGAADGWLRTAKAGTGTFSAFVNVAGDHYLAYCDEVNGYLLYREATDDWVKIVSGTGLDGLSISGAAPENFRSVTLWKKRLWFTTADSAEAVYLPVNQFAGVVDNNDVLAGGTLNFGSQFRYGGNLAGLWSWTLDGGQGVDDLLVGISRAGDVVVYQGTDPAFADSFGIKGVYWLGPVPPGRRFASDFGGDLFVLSVAGCLPLSRLVTGGLIRDPNIYETAKVSNLFNKLMSERGSLEGWAITQHPTDNLLVINVPPIAGKQPEQLVMSLANKGWAAYSGLPINCMTTWHGKLYFGTTDGRVCVNLGTTDSKFYAERIVGEGVTWDYGNYPNPLPINFSLLSSFQHLGSTAKKRVHMARPYFMVEGQPPGYEVAVRYDYNLTPVDLASVDLGIPQPAWDIDLWDNAYWGSGYGTGGWQYGTTGIGTAVAVAVRGSASVTTTLVNIDVLLDQGGLL